MIDDIQSNSTSWVFFVKASFAAALVATAVGILLIPADMIVKAYLCISALFLVSTSITLSKTLRDEHESHRLLNRLSEAKTKQFIKEYGEG